MNSDIFLADIKGSKELAVDRSLVQTILRFSQEPGGYPVAVDIINSLNRNKDAVDKHWDAFLSKMEAAGCAMSSDGLLWDIVFSEMTARLSTSTVEALEENSKYTRRMLTAVDTLLSHFEGIYASPTKFITTSGGLPDARKHVDDRLDDILLAAVQSRAGIYQTSITELRKIREFIVLTSEAYQSYQQSLQDSRKRNNASLRFYLEFAKCLSERSSDKHDEFVAVVCGAIYDTVDMKSPEAARKAKGRRQSRQSGSE